MAYAYMSKKIFKQIRRTEIPNPQATWWVTLLDEEDVLIEKFKSRWGVAPRFYASVSGNDDLIRLGPVPD